MTAARPTGSAPSSSPGFGGRLYWFSILPFHGIILSGMANRIVEAAATEARSDVRAEEPLIGALPEVTE